MSPDAASSAPSRPFRGQSPVEQVFDSTVRDVRGDERKPRPLAADYERSKAFTTVAAKR